MKRHHILTICFCFLCSCNLIVDTKPKQRDSETDLGNDDINMADIDSVREDLAQIDESVETDLDTVAEDLIDVSDTIEIPPVCGNGEIDDGEECDDGANGDPDDGCTDSCRYSCHNDSECNDGHDCTDDGCDTETMHKCINAFSSSDSVCRPAASLCDIEEYCTGTEEDCPEDDFQPAGTSCDDEQYCTYPDECNGIGLCVETAIYELYGVNDISLGGEHTCAVVETGDIKCWGNNGWGEIGNGAIGGLQLKPVDVIGLSVEATKISLGHHHTCAILNTEGLKCWGYNNHGQLGDGTAVWKSTPTDVTGLTSGVFDISLGSDHTCAILNSTALKCWGYNNGGQLGDGTIVDKSSPADVSGLSSGVIFISAGGSHTCAVLDTGGIKCWGVNNAGQLGDETTEDKNLPTDVSGLSEGVVAVSAGFSHTCALLETSGIKCWGNNGWGQIGNGSSGTLETTPVDVTGLTSGVESVSDGDAHTCALLSTGGVMCWGNNDWGQLGDGTVTASSLPVEVSGLLSGVSAVFIRGHSSCALLDTGFVKCWGNNRWGQLGDGSSGIDNISTTPRYVACE